MKLVKEESHWKENGSVLVLERKESVKKRRGMKERRREKDREKEESYPGKVTKVSGGEIGYESSFPVYNPNCVHVGMIHLLHCV
jgi:hypothetical protein